MTTMPLNHVFVPRNYDIFAGLDVDKTSISVSFLDHQGSLKSLRIPHKAEHLINYVQNHFPGQKVAFAYEAGPTGYQLHDDLTSKGHPCLVAAPSMIPTAPGQRVKTNRLDSQKIAENLRGGQLKSIHVPCESYRDLRHLTQLRDTFVRQAAATKNRIKALLLFESIPFPEAPAGSQWSKGVISQLKSLSCSLVVRFKLNQLLSSLEFAQSKAVETTKAIRHFCKGDPELQRCSGFLMSLPGIGFILASHLLARIGDWRQIQNVRQLSAFLGVVPKENSTGDRVQRGSITRSGDSRLRGKLIQGAWAAIRQDPELREFYQRIYQRHPRPIAAKKAIVAVSRKLTTRIYSVLHEQRNYVMRQNTDSVPLTQEETGLPQEMTRRQAEVEE
jgi:transposase